MPRNGGMSQGARANTNGHTCENVLVPLFEANGYAVVAWGEYKRTAASRARYDAMEKLVIKQYPYVSIYDHKGKTEFLVRNKILDREIRVEVKWQQSAGSVDEKYPYLWLNAVYAYPENEIVLIVDGGGYKPGARQWLAQVCAKRWLLDDKPSKRVSVMSLAEFIVFFNREMG